MYHFCIENLPKAYITIINNENHDRFISPSDSLVSKVTEHMFNVKVQSFICLNIG